MEVEREYECKFNGEPSISSTQVEYSNGVHGGPSTAFTAVLHNEDNTELHGGPSIASTPRCSENKNNKLSHGEPSIAKHHSEVSPTTKPHYNGEPSIASTVGHQEAIIDENTTGHGKPSIAEHKSGVPPLQMFGKESLVIAGSEKKLYFLH